MAQLVSSKSSQIYRVSYTAALLTDTQIEIFKKGKKYDHFLAPFMTRTSVLDEIDRPIAEVHFLRRFDSSSDLMKRIRQLYCVGSKNFREV